MQGGIKYHFLSLLSMTRPGIEPRSPEPLANTLIARPMPGNNLKKNRICKIVDFAVPADHRIKLKESEKKDKHLDLVRKFKKMEHEGNNNTNFDL